jgi:hypothetical protein
MLHSERREALCARHLIVVQLHDVSLSAKFIVDTEWAKNAGQQKSLLLFHGDTPLEQASLHGSRGSVSANRWESPNLTY